LVSFSGSVLNPTGGHIGEGEGERGANFFFFGALFTGFLAAGFLATGVFVAATFLVGVGVGLLLAAPAELTELANRITKKVAKTLFDFIDLAPI